MAGWPGRESGGLGPGVNRKIRGEIPDVHAGPDLGRFMNESQNPGCFPTRESRSNFKVGRERVGLGDFRVRALVARPGEGPGIPGVSGDSGTPFPEFESPRRPRRCGQKRESGSRGRRRRIFRQCVRQRPPGRFQVHSILASRKLRPSQAGYGRSRTSRSSNQREWALNRAEEATNLLYADVFRFCFRRQAFSKFGHVYPHYATAGWCPRCEVQLV